MTFRRATQLTCVVLAGSLLVGCLKGERNLRYLGDAELGYYKDQATEIRFPNVDLETSETVKFSEEPRRLERRVKDEIWDLSLQQTLQVALENNDVLVNRNQFLSPFNPLYGSSDFQVNSIYDPAIQESGILFGQRGVEAALAEFDAQFTSTMNWGRSEQVQNVAGSGLVSGDTLASDTGAFVSQLQKQFADSGQFTLSHNWNYLGTNVSASRLFQSSYDGFIRGEYRRPLWAGQGTEFTRIAGPVNRRNTLANVTQTNQGVVIARIRTDQSLVQFETSVRNLVKDVEDAYWDLWAAYAIYKNRVIARNAALRIWRVAIANKAPAYEVAQARQTYFDMRAAAEGALSGASQEIPGVYAAEGDLRRLMGLSVNDGRIIRPIDEPVTAEFSPDWRMSVVEALTQRTELRGQKWDIKSLTLQLTAAHSLTNPRLDFVSAYQVNGFGDDLLREQTLDNTGRNFNSAYGTLTQGDQTGWNLGVEFSMPLGFRAAHAQVRNLELQLAKSRAILAAQEEQITHELANAFRKVDLHLSRAQSYYNSCLSASDRVKATEAAREADVQQRIPIDLVLRAQIDLANAQDQYTTALIAYNKAIVDVLYRKGSLLTDNNVHLAESLWVPDAYNDALRRAWARSYAVPAKHSHTEPREMEGSSGTVELAIPYRDVPDPSPTNADEMLPPAPVPEDQPPAAPAVPEPVTDASDFSGAITNFAPVSFESSAASAVMTTEEFSDQAEQNPFAQQLDVRPNDLPGENSPPVIRGSGPSTTGGFAEPSTRSEEYLPPIPVEFETGEASPIGQ